MFWEWHPLRRHPKLIGECCILQGIPFEMWLNFVCFSLMLPECHCLLCEYRLLCKGYPLTIWLSFDQLSYLFQGLSPRYPNAKSSTPEVLPEVVTRLSFNAKSSTPKVTDFTARGASRYFNAGSMAPKYRFWDTLLALYAIPTPKADFNAKGIQRLKLAVKILRVEWNHVSY